MLKNLDKYYGYYLSLHQNKWNRRLHALGQLCTILFVIFCIQNSWWLTLLLAPFVIYPFAWIGHFVFEKNKPGAWNNPILSKASDWLMMKDMITGKLER